jgi:hypothetical protein
VYARQRTSQESKSLRKHVQFADYYKDCYKDPNPTRAQRASVRVCKELQTFVNKVGAIQVFCLKTSRAESPSTDRYRLSRIFDNVSFCQNPYYRQHTLQFQVSTVYKTKANKVRLVDLREADGSKPRGCLDWLKRSKATNVLCEPGLYLE